MKLQVTSQLSGFSWSDDYTKFNYFGTRSTTISALESQLLSGISSAFENVEAVLSYTVQVNRIG